MKQPTLSAVPVDRLVGRFRVVVRLAEKYPLVIVDEQSRIHGRYYECSRETAKRHCRDLNSGKRAPNGLE